MKRRDLLRHLQFNGCVLLREGACHTIMINLSTRKKAPVPRHSEVSDWLVRKICAQLGVPQP